MLNPFPIPRPAIAEKPAPGPCHSAHRAGSRRRTTASRNGPERLGVAIAVYIEADVMEDLYP